MEAYFCQSILMMAFINKGQIRGDRRTLIKNGGKRAPSLWGYRRTEPRTGLGKLHEILDIPSDLDQYKHIIGGYQLSVLKNKGV